MGFLDKLRKGATKAVDEHGDKISRGLDKAAGAVDKKTKGKYSGQIRTGVDKTKEGLDRLDDKRDHDLGGPGSPGTRPPGTTPPGTTPPGTTPPGTTPPGTTPPGTTPQSGPKQPPGSGSSGPSS